MIRKRLFFDAVVGARRADVLALANLLEVEIGYSERVTQSDAEKLWDALSYFASNSFAYALRGFSGIGYPEIVRDACKQAKVGSIVADDGNPAVSENEDALLSKVFADAWEQLSDQERRELLHGANLSEHDVKLKGHAALMGILLAQSGGFLTYQVAVIVANFLARALIGRGLAFGANAALTRGLGVVLGPVGMAVSGAVALNDLAAPATRKVLPAVVHVAMLRKMRGAEETAEKPRPNDEPPPASPPRPRRNRPRRRYSKRNPTGASLLHTGPSLRGAALGTVVGPGCP